MKPGSIVWSWRDAAFGAVITAVAAIVIGTGHVENGLPLLFGALPAAIIGLTPTRQSRKRIAVIGVLFGLSMMFGSFIAQWWWLALPGIFVLAVGAAWLASKRAFGLIAMTLCVPLAGIGLSYAGLRNSFGVSLLIIIGSFIAYTWSLLFKEFQAPKRPVPALMSREQARDYGIRLGLAAVTAAAIGYLSGTDHIGWITGAALLVMRPQKEMQELRSVGRIISVFIGALAASWLLSLDLRPWAIAILASGAVVLAAALHNSRWYITPAFTTFLVFWLLLYGDATANNIQYRFTERVWETVAGVAIAYCFGLLWPKLRERRHAAS